MIGGIDPNQRQVTVIGGGIAGLLAAYRLDQLGYEVTLHEASGRLGGLIQTRTSEYGIAEAAMHSLLASPPVIRLFDELRIARVHVRNRARFIWFKGRPRSFPFGFSTIAGALVRLALALSHGKPDPAHVDLDRWAMRHLGRRLLELGLNPFLRGIYAARPSELAVGAAFPHWVIPRGHSALSAWVARNVTGRLPKRPKRERAPMISAQAGMEALPQALARHLTSRLGDRLHLSSPVTKLPEHGNVVLAVPAREATKLLEPIEPELAQAIARTQYAPMLSVTAFVPAASVPASVRGVGVLVPESETRSRCLGILYNSSAFEGRVEDPARHASFTLMFGGTSLPEAAFWSDAEIRAQVKSELELLLGVQGEPLQVLPHRWPQAIPVYSAALLDTWRLAERTWCARPGHVLFGNWTGQVSVRGMIESCETLK